MLPCLTKKFFGFPCPGCGGQRSLIHLLHGEFSDAFMMYPAIYPLILFGLLILVNYFYPLKKYSSWSSIMAIVSVVFILGNYFIELNEHFKII